MMGRRSGQTGRSWRDSLREARHNPYFRMLWLFRIVLVVLLLNVVVLLYAYFAGLV